MDLHSFKWDCGHGEVQSLGAMLGPVHFRLADREIQPFAVMPWGNDTGPEHAELPGILRRTRGEWPCVPFGAPTAPDNLPDQWMPPAPAPVDDEFHGFSANNDWQLMAEIAGGLRLGIEYPPDHPISRLERVIQGVVGQPALKSKPAATSHCRLPCIPVFRCRKQRAKQQSTRVLILDGFCQ